MISIELKNVIAQNCEEYDSYYAFHRVGMGAHHRSCSNCTNYVKDMCTKGLHDEMKAKISRN